ncbi:hypothetical protein NDU88_001853 [Pleurodeles waltl]|uniref:Transmembrane protein n=1 Tax=Pleurodeles waltl TaxID=8319 RepID=A0AAV7LEG0_PLEWA|nr:hypothetical protein NDU88_001853 [Pleurodeles waltl]
MTMGADVGFRVPRICSLKDPTGRSARVLEDARQTVFFFEHFKLIRALSFVTVFSLALIHHGFLFAFI